MLDNKYETTKTRAARRFNNRKKALRKKRITEEVYWDSLEHPYYDNLNQYSKNKIHCSCPLCRMKTKLTKFKDTATFTGIGKYNYKHSELKRQIAMDQDEELLDD